MQIVFWKCTKFELSIYYHSGNNTVISDTMFGQALLYLGLAHNNIWREVPNYM